MPEQRNTQTESKKTTADKVLLALDLVTTAAPTILAMISNYRTIIEKGSLEGVDIEQGKQLLEGTKWPDWDQI